jgi:hypothetical protein
MYTQKKSRNFDVHSTNLDIKLIVRMSGKRIILPCDRKKLELAVTKNFRWQFVRFQLTNVSLKS